MLYVGLSNWRHIFLITIVFDIHIEINKILILTRLPSIQYVQYCTLYSKVSYVPLSLEIRHGTADWQTQLCFEEELPYLLLTGHHTM